MLFFYKTLLKKKRIDKAIKVTSFLCALRSEVRKSKLLEMLDCWKPVFNNSIFSMTALFNKLIIVNAAVQ